MKWYLASRQKHKEFINKTIDQLKSHGHEVVYEWSKFGSLKPYNEHSEEAGKVAKKITTAIASTDVFVLISDEAGTDMFVELGIVLSNSKTKIYIVGNHNDRSLMHHHPRVNRVNNLNDVFEVECPELLK